MQADDLSTRDPVCGRSVSQSSERFQTEYADVTYQFCSQGCLDRFLEQPDIFTVQPGLGQAAASDRALRDDTHRGELQSSRAARLDSSVPAADPGS